jgi:hypothetical protein
MGKGEVCWTINLIVVAENVEAQGSRPETMDKDLIASVAGCCKGKNVCCCEHMLGQWRPGYDERS